MFSPRESPRVRAQMHSPRASMMQSAALSPRASPLAALFNPGSARGPVYERGPVYTRPGLVAPPQMTMSARPQSAYVRNSVKESPRATMSPRAMLSQRGLNDMGERVSEWLYRQDAIREMVGFAQYRTHEQVQKIRVQRAHDEQRLAAEKAAEYEANVERAKLMRALLDQKRKEERLKARRAARPVSAAVARPTSARPTSPRAEAGPTGPTTVAVPDAELKRVHALVKRRLRSQYGEQVRKAFRSMDKDGSGTVSPEEVLQTLLELNLDVPTDSLIHLVNVCDYDRDGAINYAEFVRLIETDDIVSIKAAGAEEQGLVMKPKPKEFKPGVSVDEIVAVQAKLKEWFSEENGRFRRIFRAMDDDKNGWVDRLELRMLPRFTNLEWMIRPAVLECLIDFMDLDGDGRILYNEFVRIIMADDVFHP